jgi:pilus assembly protein Flp/PilA
MGEDQMNDLFLKLFVMAQNLMTRDDGQDLVEYALLVSLIALAAISGVKHVATAVNSVFSNVSSSLA